MSKLRLAVFDVDGTLVDSEHNIVSAMTNAWARMDLGVPDPFQVRKIIGLSLVDACAVLLPFATHETHRAVAEAYKDAFRALRLVPDKVEPLFPGVSEALKALEEDGWLLGLATGKSRRGVDAMLENHGLGDVFFNIQTADDNPSKPHPAMLVRAAAECGVDMDQVVMIGDTTYDMEMAKRAGAYGVGVSWGYHDLDELRNSGADLIVDDFDNLAAILAARQGDTQCV